MDRVKIRLPMRPHTFVRSDPDFDLNTTRTFGGIDRRVRPTLPNPAQIEKFNSFAKSFRESTRVRRNLIAFVNSRSGGQTGELLMQTLSANLGKDEDEGKPLYGEVCDLSKRGEPEATIERLAGDLRQQRLDGARATDTRLLVCGGDGTVTWILTALDHCAELEDMLETMPVGIVPLGTGNDLARSLGWGGKLRQVSDILDYLKWAMAASSVSLDQWRIVLRPHTRLPDDHKFRSCGSHPQLVNDEVIAQQLWRDVEEAMPSLDRGEGKKAPESGEVFLGFWQNYFSIGIDAKVANYVDAARNKTQCGQKCFRIGCGKACYAWQAGFHAVGSRVLNNEVSALKVSRPGIDSDGGLDEVPFADDGCCRCSGQRCRQLMLVNINSYGAGQQVLPNEDEADRTPAPGDGVLEVLSVHNVSAGLRIFAGLSRARYVASADAVAFTVEAGQFMQLDGEPWRLDTGCDVLVQWHRQVPMLLAPADAHFWRGHIRRTFWGRSDSDQADPQMAKQRSEYE